MYISKQLKDAFITRLKSLAWHAGSMVALGLIAFIVENSTALDIPSWIPVALGLISAQITKALNSSAK